MKRRTFSKKTGALGLAAVIAPAITMGKTRRFDVTSIDPAVRDHLAFTKKEMNLGVNTRHQAAMVKQYLEPKKIIRQQLNATGYEFSFLNQYDHTITLSSVKGQRLTRIHH